VDWGHLGTLECEGQERKLWAFTFTMGYSRHMMAEVALDQKIGSLLRKHEEAFRQMRDVPEEILYDPHEDGVARERRARRRQASPLHLPPAPSGAPGFGFIDRPLTEGAGGRCRRCWREGIDS